METRNWPGKSRLEKNYDEPFAAVFETIKAPIGAADEPEIEPETEPQRRFGFHR
jgi:hypothetical protein